MQTNTEEKYECYKKALEILDLSDLNQRRNKLCKVFAGKALKNSIISFTPNDNTHIMDLRQVNKCKETFCKTERYKKSAIPTMEVMLNQMF